MKTRQLPRTDSIRKLARFWDTHDVSDFEEKLEEVEEPMFQRRTVIALTLGSKEAKAVRKMAQTKGVADAELIHQWVRERLRELTPG